MSLVSGVRGDHDQRTLALLHGTSAGKCQWHGIISIGCSQRLLLTAELNPVLICNYQYCACIVEVCGTPFCPSSCLLAFSFKMGALSFQCEVAQVGFRHWRAQISLHLAPSLEASWPPSGNTFSFWFCRQCCIVSKKLGLESHRFVFKYTVTYWWRDLDNELVTIQIQLL